MRVEQIARPSVVVAHLKLNRTSSAAVLTWILEGAVAVRLDGALVAWSHVHGIGLVEWSGMEWCG